MEELCIEVDKQNRKICLRPLREFQTGKHIHRSSHLLLFRHDGKCLITKRSPNKKLYPNLWTYSASGVVADESYLKCVVREMKEELGIVCKPRLLFVYPYFDEVDKSFHALFTGNYNGRIKIDRMEISEINWIGLEDLRILLEKKPEMFVPHVVFGLKKYFEKLR